MGRADAGSKKQRLGWFFRWKAGAGRGQGGMWERSIVGIGGLTFEIGVRCEVVQFWVVSESRMSRVFCFGTLGTESRSTKFEKP